MLRGLQSEVYRARDNAVSSTAFYVAGFWSLPVRAGSVRPEPIQLQPVARYEYVGRSDNVRADEVSLLTVGVSVPLEGHASKLQLNYLKDLRDGFGEDALRVQWQVEF